MIHSHTHEVMVKLSQSFKTHEYNGVFIAHLTALKKILFAIYDIL